MIVLLGAATGRLCYPMHVIVHLSSRVIRNTSPGVLPIRLLVLVFLLPSIIYGLPFWNIRKCDFLGFNSIISAPLRRVLHLPPSTHRLTVLADCGVPDIATLCEKSLFDMARRFRHLPHDHPSFIIYCSSSFTSFNDRLRTVLRAWSLRASSPPAQVHRAITTAQMTRWRAANLCHDLITARPVSSAGLASHYRSDTSVAAAIRARLRMNRSNLNHSQFRRHMISSGMCSCELGDETVAHLLVCAHYDHLRIGFRHLPFFFKITANFLLGEVSRLRSRYRMNALRVGSWYLCAVDQLRPGGI
jgi:hypothetical protein